MSNERGWKHRPATDKSSKAIYAVWIAAIILIVLSLLTSGCGCLGGYRLAQYY